MTDPFHVERESEREVWRRVDEIILSRFGDLDTFHASVAQSAVRRSHNNNIHDNSALGENPGARHDNQPVSDECLFRT